MKELIAKADAGDASAQYELAMAYDNGFGAVAQGHGEAHTNLGFLYDLGKGVAQDGARAVELYLKGAESGSLNAMLNLGLSYRQGTGVEVDRVEAFKWLELARFYTQRTENMQLKWRVRGVLDELQKEMSKAEIKDGKRRSKAWDAAHRPR
jgi:TPR repeat protein